jgi:hypothetical protein
MHKIDPMPAERIIWLGVAEMSRIRHRVARRGRSNQVRRASATPQFTIAEKRKQGWAPGALRRPVQSAGKRARFALSTHDDSIRPQNAPTPKCKRWVMSVLAWLVG